MNTFNGKAIYNPSGKAGEYSQWACNFYNGCSNGCGYCYCKTGILAPTLGGDHPTLKKCFRDEKHALEVFQEELMQNLAELQEHGLFFSFTTDPMLPETIRLTECAMDLATDHDVPVKILTKRADWVDYLLPRLPINWHNNYAFGFTLTGHDELEPNASTNAERIKAMQKLYKAGFSIFASIEPIIDLDSSLQMICATYGSCDHYKIGLESGKRYDRAELQIFITTVLSDNHAGATFYFKDSLLKAAGIDRKDLPANCVGRDYNIFNNK